LEQVRGHAENSCGELTALQGLSGIVAARRYLQANPDCHLLVIEKDSCVGRVWSERRIYLNFWTQWTYGVAEFSDMPMERPPAEDCKHDQFKAEYTNKYLEAYVDQ
jgi:cation diffusion facilitator CzcD-associated flavoprotein CzcO